MADPIAMPDQSVQLIDPRTGRLTADGFRLFRAILRKLNSL